MRRDVYELWSKDNLEQEMSKKLASMQDSDGYKMRGETIIRKGDWGGVRSWLADRDRIELGAAMMAGEAGGVSTAEVATKSIKPEEAKPEANGPPIEKIPAMPAEGPPMPVGLSWLKRMQLEKRIEELRSGVTGAEKKYMKEKGMWQEFKKARKLDKEHDKETKKISGETNLLRSVLEKCEKIFQKLSANGDVMAEKNRELSDLEVKLATVIKQMAERNAQNG
jgi:hypothetical protein